MLRDRSYYFLFLVPVLTLTACGSDKPVDETTGAVQEAIPTGGYHFVGTYANSSRQVGSLSQLVLKTDGTFHSAKVVACITAPCNDIEQNGTYTLFRRDTFAYFELYERSSHTAVARYQYTLRGDTLNIRPLSIPTAPIAPTATWISMQRAPAAWCAITSDCAQQDLTPGPCAGQYICTEKSICNYQCGAAPEIARDNGKTRSGG